MSASSNREPVIHGLPILHICLKAGHSPSDHLRAWSHASEVVRLIKSKQYDVSNEDEPYAIVGLAYKKVVDIFPDFLHKLEEAGWNTKDGAFMTRTPQAVLISIEDSEAIDGSTIEEKKKQ